MILMILRVRTTLVARKPASPQTSLWRWRSQIHPEEQLTLRVKKIIFRLIIIYIGILIFILILITAIILPFSVILIRP